MRTLEAHVKQVLTRQELLNADTQLFRPQTRAPFIDDMVALANSSSDAMPLDATRDRGVRLAFLRFLESLFGDVVYHVCALDAPGATADDDDASAATSRVLVFEVDAFLDAHIELGCREFFRQCFQTQVRMSFTHCCFLRA